MKSRRLFLKRYEEIKNMWQLKSISASKTTQIPTSFQTFAFAFGFGCQYVLFTDRPLNTSAVFLRVTQSESGASFIL